MLTRFWFRFGPAVEPSFIRRGCGITARDLDDAKRLLRDRIFQGGEVPPISEIVEGVDVSTLDQTHVIPNMGDCTLRGIWFPRRF